MSEMVIKGIVKFVGIEEQVSASFTKREVVVSTEEQYPQHILINFTQGKCNNELDQTQIGEAVSVSINIKGREWVNPQGETKYFNDIQGWRISKDMGTHTNATAAPAPAQPQTEQVFVFTATDATEAAYRAQKWTNELMVQHGKGKWETRPVTPKTPAAPVAPAVAAAPENDLPF